MAGPSWWVVGSETASNPGQVNYKAVQSVSKPARSVAGPFQSKSAANNWISNKTNAPPLKSPIPNPVSVVTNWASSWLQGLGGQIGSGIESAFVSGLTDLWDVIVGPLEIIAGFTFIIIAFLLFFKDDIMNLGYLFGAGAKVAF